MAVDTDSMKYWAPVDRNAPNNPHSFSLQLIGRDKHVLELGCAAGHVTRALVQQGCTVVGVENDEEAAKRAAEVAEDVLVVDLSSADDLTQAVGEQRFDVVLAGDVLEHLPDPVGVLYAARRLLRPGGFVVLSLPNIAHVDVKLHLLTGRFDYQEYGLLDRTHLRFFTFDSVVRLLDDADLQLAEVRRVVRPPFDTELAVDRATVPAEALALAMRDAEAETYQFVVKAVPNDADGEVARAAQRYRELDATLGQERLARLEAERERDGWIARVRDLELQVQALEEARLDEHFARQELEALRQTKTFRATARLRRAYSRVRRRG
jgi:2-polyprenyl-3-methyl-5-hydroxy-6-metoxy-1,4-benzoquinol methylase